MEILARNTRCASIRKDGYGNTHSLKNSKRFWQGTVEKFNAKFKRA